MKTPKVAGELTIKELTKLVEEARNSSPIRIYVVLDISPKEEIIGRYLDKFTVLREKTIRYSIVPDRIHADDQYMNLSLDHETHVFLNFWFAYARAQKASGKTPRLVT